MPEDKKKSIFADIHPHLQHTLSGAVFCCDESQPQIDVTHPQTVEIVLSPDYRVWINVDGVCMFRACNVEQVTLDDARLPGQLHEN